MLIDADLRRPAIAKTFDLPSGSPGLSNVLAGTEQLDDCIRTVEQGFDVLSAGIVPTNPLEMLSSSKLKALVTSLAEKYDRIIIDSAPVTAVSDSLILATLADSLIYVVKADATPATLTGVVLNKLDMKRPVPVEFIRPCRKTFGANHDFYTLKTGTLY